MLHWLHWLLLMHWLHWLLLHWLMLLSESPGLFDALLARSSGSSWCCSGDLEGQIQGALDLLWVECSLVPGGAPFLGIEGLIEHPWEFLEAWEQKRQLACERQVG
jgi:hypothetical protein